MLPPYHYLGDFNIIRKECEKNKSRGCNRWSFIFNSIKENAGLREVNLSGRSFTWSNDHENPTYELLDRVLVSNSWEQHHPLVCTGNVFQRSFSDHVPLFVNTGNVFPRSLVFRFEIC